MKRKVQSTVSELEVLRMARPIIYSHTTRAVFIHTKITRLNSSVLPSSTNEQHVFPSY